MYLGVVTDEQPVQVTLREMRAPVDVQGGHRRLRVRAEVRVLGVDDSCNAMQRKRAIKSKGKEWQRWQRTGWSTVTLNETRIVTTKYLAD